MAELLGENRAQDNGGLLEVDGHAPGPAFLARGTAVHLRARLRISGWAALLSIAAAQIFQSPPAIDPIKPVSSVGMDRDRAAVPGLRPRIPEAAGVPARYAIRRNAEGGGRKDIFSLGDAGRRGALSAGRDLPARPARLTAFAAPQDELDGTRRRGGPDRRLAQRRAAGQQVRAAVDRRLRRDRQPAAPLPRLRARLRRSAAANVRLVLPGRPTSSSARRLPARSTG